MQVNRAKCGIQRLILQNLLEPGPITALEASATALRDGTRLLSHVPSAGCLLTNHMQPRLDYKPAASYAVMSSMRPQPDAEPGVSFASMGSTSPQPSAEPGAITHGASSRHDHTGAGPASQQLPLGLSASPSCLSVSSDAHLDGSLAQGIPHWHELPARGTLDAQLSAYPASAQQDSCSPQASSLTPNSNSDNHATQDAPSIAEAKTPAAASNRSFRGPISPEWLATESPAPTIPAWAHQAGGHDGQDSQTTGDASSPARAAAQDGGHLISRTCQIVATGSA